MPAMATLYEPVARELEKVCQIFDDELFSDLPIVNELCDHIRHYRGKMLRPALLLLAGKACGKLTDQHLTLAAVVETVHMATLVHDDVLDDGELRRRCPTISRLQGNEAAILLGDYLISHAYRLCSSLESQFAACKIGSTTNTICEGELQQVHHRGDYDLTVEQYLEIVSRKTASLTGTCCLLGAYFADAQEDIVAAFERYGLNVGTAFQITDDVLDIVGSEERMGKTLGRDLEKHKLTLPVIHCLNQGDLDTQRQVRALLDTGDPDRGKLRQLLEATDSISYSLNAAREYVDSAISCLDNLPDSESRDTLVRITRLVIERDE